MSHTKHGLATTQVLGLAWLSHWLGCPLERGMGWVIVVCGHGIERAGLAATTNAGSKLPAPGCPLGWGEVDGVAD
ncbi:hypothetical protein V8C86DRAFT_2591860 [Haematococcus lacustris]